MCPLYLLGSSVLDMMDLIYKPFLFTFTFVPLTFSYGMTPFSKFLKELKLYSQDDVSFSSSRRPHQRNKLDKCLAYRGWLFFFWITSYISNSNGFLNVFFFSCVFDFYVCGKRGKVIQNLGRNIVIYFSDYSGKIIRVHGNVDKKIFRALCPKQIFF